ncbi:MAG TPA: BamA/TamA family outer membrane protein [Bacteroidia bacterium]|jgi:outer membrane protein assembly factor BamA|nr:BamA/TamA family outer membrane protein [Bacteroidia bacterium]
MRFIRLHIFTQLLRKRNFLYLSIAFTILSCGCNSTKYLAAGEDLYVGSTIRIESKDKIKDKGTLKTELGKLARPKPNERILWARPKLWFYNIGTVSPNSKIKKWLKKKWGEKPVLLSDERPKENADLMVSRLNSLGYFESRVNYKIKTSRRKATITYTAIVNKPYILSKLTFPEKTDSLNAKISATEEKTLLRVGKPYNLDIIKNERVRIDRELKNKGYYFFTPDYLLFKADSNAQEKTINLELTVKNDAPEKAKVAYTLNQIYIHPAFSLDNDSLSHKAIDTINIEGYHYINTDTAFHPSVILRSVFLKKGDPYSRTAHNLTISRLMGMGVFKFANIKFVDTIIDHKGLLDVWIYLTPIQKKSLQVQVETVTKSNNFTGPALTLSYKNRNLLKGAELFVFNLDGSFETQLTGPKKGLNSFEFGAGMQLFVPKFLTLGFIRNRSSQFVPKTKFDAGIRLLHRAEYFDMTSMNLSYGYTWKKTAQQEFQFDPVTINFSKLLKTSTIFEELLEQNTFLRKSFEQQFIIGSRFSYTYNSIVGEQKRHQYYFNLLLDFSGNRTSLVQSLITKQERPYKLFGFEYSQFSKIATDTRYYYTMDKDNKIATRLIAGVGVPYGNSTTMPYIKQFFSGGSNSIRAFLPRTVGPGSYKRSDSSSTQVFLDQSGDIKLEGNAEYRFTIISVVKGAIFIDAGNVWNIRKNEALPGGEFKSSQFLNQVAVGTGAGLRVDVSFFVIRLDLGIPLRKPYLPSNERWVGDDIRFGSPSWRKNNLVWNIAIGYPF